ncbi:MAG TPA: hypothetical protein DHW29_02440, partial [Acinetobacter ursingii]|nr:hypothetical protein [Acinetobacter ursingii]
DEKLCFEWRGLTKHSFAAAQDEKLCCEWRGLTKHSFAAAQDEKLCCEWRGLNRAILDPVARSKTWFEVQ